MCEKDEDQKVLETLGVYTLDGMISEETVIPIVNSIMFENAAQRLDRIYLVITSGGGDVAYAFKLIDAIRMSSIPITAIGIGEVYSSAFMIFIAAHERLLTENVSILCHQFSMSFGDSVKEHEILAYNSETKNVRNRMFRLIEKYSNLTHRQISKTFFGPSDFWMTAEEMIKFKLADRIVTDFDWLPRIPYPPQQLDEELLDNQDENS
jgi:ATP-dependent protease ClpP protease subunit